MKQLLDAVREGRFRDVPGLLKPLTPAERRACLAELKALRTELRGFGWERWQERFKILRALLPAGAGCHTGAAAAAAWIGARDLRMGDRPVYTVLLEVLSDRSPGWLGDVAHRLAGRASTVQEDYPLIHELVRLAKCAVPTTDGYVYGWAEAVASARGPGLRSLGKDPQVRILAPRLFETPELAPTLSWYDDPDAPGHWPSALSDLAAEGVLDRSMLVDSCVSRLLRGGQPGDMRFFLILLRRLALTAEEERARVSDWIGMAADGASTVAAHAQSVLARLAESGELSSRSLAEASGSVLFRSEKKLVRAQLVLIGKVLRLRDAEAARELLPVAAEAFGHEDVGVQERALKLVGRYLPVADAALREELAASAVLLSPVHRPAAVEIFGALPEEDSGAYEETLPPAPELRRPAPAPGSVAELVEDVLVLTRPGNGPSDFERTLDGLVRLAHREPEALTEALRGALAGRWWLDGDAPWDPDDRFSAHPHGVEVVAAALLGRVSVQALDRCRARSPLGDCAHAGLVSVVHARLWEAAYFVRTEPLPFLLATPTWHTGALDPFDLVERLRDYQRLGATPAPVDFGQALLRVRRGGDAAAAEAAARLGTDEGDRLAAWIRKGEPAIPALRTTTEPAEAATTGTTRRLLTETRERLAIQRAFPRPLRWLGRPHSVSHGCCYHSTGRQHWTAVLPHDRETLATWLLPGVRACAEDDQTGGTWCLPLLAEAGGPAGPALHLALATGLGARRAEDRLAAVDGLLVLAARGQLDGGRLGRLLSGLVVPGTVKPNRLAESARTAAATGAYATTWSVLAAALPGLLTGDVPARGLGEILAVAADCVERCGAGLSGWGSAGAVPSATDVDTDADPVSDTAEIPGFSALAALAGRGGSSQLVAQASRLVAALHHGGEHSTPETAKSSR
ncbi:DUF6493 family protein [Streptomyces sp. NBC_01142]|uniref:DUF7824 domain-containing protein n=1 Tax=Streptomyces sp. NBC_01142 TaxID=2975865 RepID=UPI002253B9A0|nr:DUF6493 family protein [Streptomyces sp. NBC_01142]MCX4824847.1 DUF6493 family protein [Streptomyces sp. NBC_01142]